MFLYLFILTLRLKFANVVARRPCSWGGLGAGTAGVHVWAAGPGHLNTAVLRQNVTLPTVCVSSTHTHTRACKRTHWIDTEEEGDTEMLDVRPRASPARLPPLPPPLVHLSSCLLLPSFLGAAPPSSLQTGRPWSIVSPPLVSYMASPPPPTPTPPPPPPPHCVCETIGRCNI